MHILTDLNALTIFSPNLDQIGGFWPKRAAHPGCWGYFEKNVIFVLFSPQSNFLIGSADNLTIHLFIAHL